MKNQALCVAEKTIHAKQKISNVDKRMDKLVSQIVENCYQDAVKSAVESVPSGPSGSLCLRDLDLTVQSKDSDVSGTSIPNVDSFASQVAGDCYRQALESLNMSAFNHGTNSASDKKQDSGDLETSGINGAVVSAEDGLLDVGTEDGLVKQLAEKIVRQCILEATKVLQM